MKYTSNYPRTLNGWVEIFTESKSYLIDKLKTLVQKRKELKDEIVKDFITLWRKDLDEDSFNFGLQIINVFKCEELERNRKQINEITFALKPPKKKSSITDEMIKRAESYPLEKLLDINNRGFANCIFHKDSHPSMYCRGGYAYCFSCGENADAIKILRTLKNISFKEAVLSLQ